MKTVTFMLRSFLNRVCEEADYTPLSLQKLVKGRILLHSFLLDVILMYKRLLLFADDINKISEYVFQKK